MTTANLAMTHITPRAAAAVADYDRYVRLTRYTHAEVDAVWADVLAAEAGLNAVCEAAEALLAPQRVCMGIWEEIQDTRYQQLAAAVAQTVDARWVACRYGSHGSSSTEMFPLTGWRAVAAQWRGMAKRIQREITRLQRAH